MTPEQKKEQETFDRQRKQHGVLCKYIVNETLNDSAFRAGICVRTAREILRKFGYPVGYKKKRGCRKSKAQMALDKLKAPVVLPVELPRKCKVSRCYSDSRIAGFCSAHYQAQHTSNDWEGSLRMGKRLTAKQKARAQGVGTFIEPVRIFGKI